MKLFILTILFFISSFAFSQSYSLKGVTINESNMPMEAVTCILRKANDSIWIKTVISDSEGKFAFSDLSKGSYNLKLQHMACESEEHDIEIGTEDIDLPPFVLLSLSKDLNEVVVSAERPVVKADGGKLVYDIPLLVKDKVVSNAFEILQNVPGVMGVGDDLQLVGTSEYTILINGQLTSMNKAQVISLLKSMPASRIANIEIMYSTPPQYNIKGAAINVVLKDQSATLPTLQGEGSLEYKQAHYAEFEARGNILYTKPSFNADLTVGVHKQKGWGESNMYALHQYKGHLYDITQNNISQSDSKDLNLRLGLAYTFSNKSKLRLVYTSEMDNSNSYPTSKTIFLADNKPFSNVDSKSNKKGNSYLHNVKIEYNSNKNLNMGLDYTSYKDPATEKYYDYVNGSVLQTTFKNETEQKVDKIVLFANHTSTLKEWKLNYGGNFSYSENNNSYDYYQSPEGQVVDSINDTNQKEYNGSIFAGFTKSFGSKLSAQGSVSGNYFRAEIDIMGKKKTLWNDFQPFVNANLNYTHSPKRILQLSFSSDIKYPPYWALSADVFKINAYSLAQGNPELKFSKLYKTQLLFIMNQKYIVGGYYEYNPDHYIQLPYQSEDRLENVFQMVNLDYSKKYGLFFVVPFMVDKVFNTKATLNLIRQEQKDNNFYSVPYKNSLNTFVVQINNTFNISSKPNIKLDITGFYMHGAIQGIYNIEKMWDVTSGVKWTFLNNNAELMAQVQDIFKGRATTTKIDYMNQYSKMKIKADAPLFRLSFTYRFGNYKKPKVETVDKSRFGR